MPQLQRCEALERDRLIKTNWRRWEFTGRVPLNCCTKTRRGRIEPLRNIDSARGGWYKT